MKNVIIICSLFVLYNLNLTAQTLPDINQKIIKYTKTVIDKKVARGECWDLIAFALDDVKADWTRTTDFGDEINYKEDKILAGDIISFKKVEFKFPNGSMTFYFHFAIIYAVNSDGTLNIAHQNFNNQRKVVLTDINLKQVTKGIVKVFRPREAK